jgi:D-3-phosphoglycerate dehydrogenase
VVINALLEGLFIRGFGDLNIINAPAKAKELGVKTIKSIKQSDGEQNRNIVSVKILLETGELNLSAAVFNNEIYSVLDINGHNIRFGLEGKLIWITNEDKPGVVAYVSKILAEAGVNIENFYLGKKGQTAQSVIQISDAISARLIEKIQSFNLIHTAKFINLED